MKLAYDVKVKTQNISFAKLAFFLHWECEYNKISSCWEKKMSVWNFSLAFIPHSIFFFMFALFFWPFQQRNTEIWLMWQVSALIWLRLWCDAVMTQTRCSVFTGWLVGGWYTRWLAAVSRPSLYFHFPLWVVSLLIVCYPVCSSASRLHPQSHLD